MKLSERKNLILVCSLLLVVKSNTSADEVQFNRDIRPILANHCFACHGPDAAQRQAELRLDLEATAKADRDPKVIVAHNTKASELVNRINTADHDLVMPPVEFDKSLSAKQKTLLTQWIEQGAAWDDHWAFVSPVSPSLPPAKQEWVNNAIDQFVVARMRKLNSDLGPSPLASRATLIRRLSFDLRGLPPTMKEVLGFVTSGDYESVVDGMLASEQFGERLGMHWLDLVRYADSGGYHSDVPIHISPYRDYVIQAFNKNMPFDQFTREQLAGDLLPQPTQHQIIATGYNRLNKTTEEGGAQPGEYLTKYAADRVRTTAGTWLGLTLGCCECHDHKYDPFTAKDFYRFVACFADIEEKGVYGGSKRDPEIKVATAPQAKQLAVLVKQLALLQLQVKDAAEVGTVQKKIAAIKSKQAAIEKQFVWTMVTRSVEPKVIRVLPRGDWLNSNGTVVSPGVPEHFVKEMNPSEQRFTRLDLANWIVAKDNPLTSRVFVNRLWKMFFGRGLSSRLDDLGIQGEWPTHPALLDYLSVRFVDSGWNVKQIIKLIVMSRTYQQSSTLRPIDTSADPTNLYFARQSRWRLEAEFIRDNALSVSGLLDSTIGGPSVFPYQPSGYWRYLNFPKRTWKSDIGTSQYRRGLYTHWQRTLVHPAMLALDAPTREECTAMRSISNTPAAALTLLNDPTFVEAARALAVRVVQEGGERENDKVRWLFLQVLSRPETKQEREVVVQILLAAREHYTDDPLAAAELQTNGLFTLASTVDVIEVSAWTMACRVVLNLSETITRN